MPPSSSSTSLLTPCAPTTGPPSSVSASARPVSSTPAPGPSDGRSTWTGPTSGSGRSSRIATACRSGRERQSGGRAGRADVLSPPSAQQPGRDPGGSRGRRRDHPQRPAVPGRRLRCGRVRPRLDGRRRARRAAAGGRVASRPWRACARWSMPLNTSSPRSPTSRAWWPPSWPALPASGRSSSMPLATRRRDRLADRRPRRSPRPAGGPGRGAGDDCLAEVRR